MPYYEFACEVHGAVDEFRLMANAGDVAYCPECGRPMQRLFSPPNIRIITKPRLQYGDGSPGRMITHAETGGLDIFIPSDGAMEQEEVDYIAAGAIEKEKARVNKAKKQGPRSESQARIAAYAELGRRAPRGKRAKTIKEAITDTGDHLLVRR